LLFFSRAGLLQEYASHEGDLRRQQPLNPPELNGLKVGQVLNRVNDTDRNRCQKAT